MIETFLVPGKTVVTAKGDSDAVDLLMAETRVFLLTLGITDIVEQESLDVSIQGSADGTTFDPKPLASFPQQFYRGDTPLLVDVSAKPEVKMIRAHWEVNRWGRGAETPRFELCLACREVPREIIAANAAHTNAG